MPFLTMHAFSTPPHSKGLGQGQGKNPCEEAEIVYKITFASLLYFYNIFLPMDQKEYLGLFLPPIVRNTYCLAQRGIF